MMLLVIFFRERERDSRRIGSRRGISQKYPSFLELKYHFQDVILQRIQPIFQDIYNQFWANSHNRHNSIITCLNYASQVWTIPPNLNQPLQSFFNKSSWGNWPPIQTQERRDGTHFIVKLNYFNWNLAEVDTPTSMMTLTPRCISIVLRHVIR